ncbi:MAG TPA: phosphatase PAP2 family protein [Candidatus Elarobacter sp.]
MIRYLALACCGGLLYALLGIAVSHGPPAGIDVAGRALAGEAPRLALVFTESCWWEMLTALGIIAVIGAIRYPAWRARVILALATTLVTWQLSDVMKNVFKRPRPDYWTLIHEPTYAYSSGHAMFAFLVYGLWAWFFWRSELPQRTRVVVSVFLALWGCGVIWSRLALGAHYVTDLVGGVLLGATALSTAFAIAAAVRVRTTPSKPAS